VAGIGLTTESTMSENGPTSNEYSAMRVFAVGLLASAFFAFPWLRWMWGDSWSTFAALPLVYQLLQWALAFFGGALVGGPVVAFSLHTYERFTGLRPRWACQVA